MTVGTPTPTSGAASPQQRKVLLMGLPETGKSTYLGALWHIVESHQVPGSLELVELAGEWEYVNSLRQKWCSAEDMERTRGVSRQRQQQIVMILREPTTRAIISLIVPDHAGEVYEAQWKDRRWTREYADFIDGVAGILLFLHAKGKHKPESISDYQETLAGLGLLEEEGEDVPGEQINKDSTTLGSRAPDTSSVIPLPEDEYDAAKAAPQVKLVDLLQMHATCAALSRPTRVSVIVSAWDAIEKVNNDTGGTMTPAEYIRQEAPLLDQYLRANPGSFTVRVFGVSAQGGDLETEREKLLSHMSESNRVRVVAEDMQMVSHDITSPIRWILDGS